MNQKLALEKKGEKTTNYLRLFLTIIFTAGTAFGYQDGTTVSLLLEFYIIGIGIYALALPCSLLLLRFGTFNTNYKYYTSALEYIGYGILLSGLTTLDDSKLASLGVQNIPLFSINFILIASSILRFSTRFTIINTFTSTSIFLFVSITVFINGASMADPKLAVSTIVTAAVFILTMGLLAATAVFYVNRLLDQYKTAEEKASAQSSSLESIVINTGMAVGDLNRVVQKISNTIAHNKELTDKQMELGLEMGSHIEKAQSSSIEISKTAQSQHDLSINNGGKIQNLEEVMSEVEEISKEITAFGHQTLIQAKSGEQELQHTVQEIENISKASKKVSQIVSVINEIAGQTDLLALNAAIEAARAGENGRGFAVVAQEVSKLADQAGKQAKQIEGLVTEMNQATITGVEKIQSTVQSTNQTITGVNTMVRKIEHISGLLLNQLQYTRELLANMQKIQDMSNTMHSATKDQSSENRLINDGLKEFQNQTEEMIQAALSIDEAMDQLKKTSTNLTESSRIK